MPCCRDPSGGDDFPHFPAVTVHAEAGVLPEEEVLPCGFLAWGLRPFPSGVSARLGRFRSSSALLRDQLLGRFCHTTVTASGY